MLNGRKRRPTHPGEILREDVLPSAGLTQGDFAERLGLSRKTVNEILREKAPVTVDVAHRLARVLNTSPEVWLRLQQDVDVWDALQKNNAAYRKLKPLPTEAAV
jgi:addiction module HigA family antidote